MSGSCFIPFVVLLGCGDRNLPRDFGLCTDAMQLVAYYPQAVEKDLDVLLVLDTSPAMAPQVDTLARSLPKMVEALRSKKIDNQIPNVHIGVISADLGAGSYSAFGCKPGGVTREPLECFSQSPSGRASCPLAAHLAM
jgi:hypothetical protein